MFKDTLLGKNARPENQVIATKLAIFSVTHESVSVPVVRDRKIRTALRTNQIERLVTVPSEKKSLKAVRIPCCCRWRRRGSATPLMYGSTAVDLNYAVSLSGVGFLVLVTFCKKDGG